jgi:two-component system CheB/CheR fusion protein
MGDESTTHSVGRGPSNTHAATTDYLIVGIGASAGGIDALRQFFSQVSAESGLAYIVVLHLSPRHASSLASVLQAVAGIPVTQVTGTVEIQPNHVYVNPPTEQMIVADGCLRLVEFAPVKGGHTSIDEFFRSLAEAHQKDAVAVILSGTGSDGTLGLRRIKEKGGFVIAQDPAEAAYDGMPGSAIATGLVDLTLPAAEIPGRLLTLNNGAQQSRFPEEALNRPVLDLDFATMQEILAMVRQQTGDDFSQYKRQTLQRRIARRLQVHDLPDAASYLEFLRTHPGEIPVLMRDLLISVTNFFRDRESFEVLESEVVPRLFEGKTGTDQVRAWVAGCATGEEAYSLAILLLEYSERLASSPRIQIFATDIDDTALAEARACRYPQAIAIDVSADRLRKYFRADGDFYRVRKEVRELILFAPHNVLRDPPFSKLDLVSCRNLLIYLNNEAQKRVLATFHFAMLPSGHLFLGASESADVAPSLFIDADKKHHIYTRRRHVTALPVAPLLPLTGPRYLAHALSSGPRVSPSAAAGELHQQMLERLAPPSCLIDENYAIVHMSDHAGRYMRLTGGEPTHNLIKVILPELRLDLQVLLLGARSNSAASAAVSRRVNLKVDGENSTVDLRVRRVAEGPNEPTGFFLVMFDEIVAVPAASAETPDTPVANSAIVEQLEQELQRTRDALHATVEQYETSTEELKASNEEFQAINEELRSTTEELETSKEELESVNEELTTVNQELRENLDELGRANSDMQNLLSATDLGIIFLDRTLQIKLYTARALDLFNITSADIGRPLDHFTNRLDYPGLTADAEAVLRTLQSTEREVCGADGRWYLARLVPYRTLTNEIDGVVINFVDITEHRHARELRLQAAAMQEEAEILRLAANVFICDLDDHIILWNATCEELFGYTREEAVGRTSAELLATEFPQPLDAINAALLANGSWDGEVIQVTRTGARLTIATRWMLHRKESGEPSAILKIFHDVTARKRAEDDLREAEKYKDQFLAMLSHELRNPLAAILSSLELLRENGNDQETIRLSYGVMDRQFAHLLRLVDDLLDVARIGQGKIALKKERITLTQAVDAALETASPLLGPHRGNLRIAMPRTPIYVDADRGRLAQIVSNLLHNAAKYTPASGRIEVIGAIEDGNAVLRVRDNGIGIAPEVLPSIFEFYAQGPSSSESNRRGLGVGLALARQLVELHGGSISASSAGRGEGSEFIVRLPLSANQSPVAAITSAGLVAPSFPQKVLVIDDERDVADTLAQVLRRLGHQVWTAYSGSSGIETAITNRPDIALVDLSMPDMDGYEVARQLRERLPGILLIALTGLIRDSDRQRARDAGFAHHVAKPANVGKLEALFRDGVTPPAAGSVDPSR